MLEDVVAINTINDGMTNKIAPDVSNNSNRHISNKMSSDVVNNNSSYISAQGNESHQGNKEYQGNKFCEGNKDLQIEKLEDLQIMDLGDNQNINEKIDNNNRNVNIDDSCEGVNIKHVVQKKKKKITKSHDGCVQSVEELDRIEEVKITDIPYQRLTENDRNVNSNTNRKNESIQSEEEHRNKEKEKMKISLERLVDDKKSIPSSEQEINCEDRSVYMVSRKIKLKAENVKETKLLSEELTKGEGITMSSPGMDKTEYQFISTQMDHGVEKESNHDDESVQSKVEGSEEMEISSHRLKNDRNVIGIESSVNNNCVHMVSRMDKQAIVNSFEAKQLLIEKLPKSNINVRR